MNCFKRRLDSPSNIPVINPRQNDINNEHNERNTNQFTTPLNTKSHINCINSSQRNMDRVLRYAVEVIGLL